MKPQSMEINDLVKMYLNKELLLPEMQRKYVWTSTKIRNLLDSIYRDYPSGSILMWRSAETQETRDSAVVSGSESMGRPFTQKLYLLDGQQRITSLATILTGDPIGIKEGDNLVKRHVDIYFNLDHPEKLDIESDDTAGLLGQDVDSKNDDARNRFFQVRNSAIENQPNWISVTKLFREGPHAILRDLKISYDDPKYEQYYKRLNQLYTRRENYVYPVQTLPETITYQEATDVFIRVNSAGTRLSGPDLALALVTSRWPGSMKLFDKFVTECYRTNFELEAGFLIRCVMALATGQSRFDRIGKMPIEDIKTAWEQIKPGLEYTINFVKNNAKIQTSTIIPSLYVLIPLSVYAVKSGLNFGKEERVILRWFYAASMWGHYGRGSSESILDEDLKALKSDHPGDALMRNLIEQIGRVEVNEEDLEGRGTNSSFFMMLYVLAMRNSAKDWGTGLEFSLTSIGKGHKIQHDHIFPRAKITRLLRQVHPNYDQRTITALVNDMANIAFLSERENPKKADREPKHYLAKIQGLRGDAALTAQYVPLEESLREMGNYEEFLRRRRSLIVQAINALIAEIERPVVAQQVLGTLTLIANGENESVEFKSSLRWDYKNNSTSSAIGIAVAKAIASLMNAKGGTVLIGVDDSKNILGLEKDFLSFGQDKQNEDGFGLHLVQVVKNYLGVERMEQVHPRFEQIDGKTVARIEIEHSPSPVFLKVNDKTEFYVKMANSSQPLNTEETLRYVQSHWRRDQLSGLHQHMPNSESLDDYTAHPKENSLKRSELVEQGMKKPTLDPLSATTSPLQAPLPQVSRALLSKLPEGQVIICPARPEGVSFLLEYNAWGFVGVKRIPRYFVLYVKSPVGYTKYFAEVDKVLDPKSPESPVTSYQNYRSYEEGKKIIVLKKGSLKELTDGLRLGEKHAYSHSFWYTSLRRFISANTLDDTT